jgi:mono/diheme cytochrome c family protein
VAAGLIVAASLTGVARSDESSSLQFARHGNAVATLDRAALQQIQEPRVVRVFEPYEGAEARFEALPLPVVLDHVYGPSWRDEEELLFTCRDGYQPTVPVRRVLAHSAWLAVDRPGVQGFTIDKLESGRRQRIDLSPAYLVWENLDDAQIREEGDYGWPYQLVGVDVVRARDRFPRMAPPVAAPADVHAGFRAFRVHCSRCHTVNGDGGRIGPELNGPVPSVSVRDADWLRRWIEDPSEILPTARMPRLNPALADREAIIDEILAYLRAMAAARPAGPRAEADPR